MSTGVVSGHNTAEHIGHFILWIVGSTEIKDTEMIK